MNQLMSSNPQAKNKVPDREEATLWIEGVMAIVANLEVKKTVLKFQKQKD